MFDFDAGSFSDLYGTSLGQSIWSFLNSEKAVDCMETTTYLRRPAVEGLQPSLLEKFGDEIKVDRCKQMIGRMVRQILERRGYALDQTGVRTKVADIFLSGARYIKKT